MRYLLQKENASEQKLRKQFLYDVFHLWFVNNGTIGEFDIFETFPFSNNNNILMVYGHNFQVKSLLKLYSKMINENDIFIISCADNLKKNYSLEGKRVYLCPQNNGTVKLLRGKEFGFEFDITETELALYNCKKTNAYEKLLTAFEI